MELLISNAARAIPALLIDPRLQLLVGTTISFFAALLVSKTTPRPSFRPSIAHHAEFTPPISRKMSANIPLPDIFGFPDTFCLSAAKLVPAISSRPNAQMMSPNIPASYIFGHPNSVCFSPATVDSLGHPRTSSSSYDSMVIYGFLLFVFGISVGYLLTLLSIWKSRNVTFTAATTGPPHLSINLNESDTHSSQCRSTQTTISSKELSRWDAFAAPSFLFRHLHRNFLRMMSRELYHQTMLLFTIHQVTVSSLCSAYQHLIVELLSRQRTLIFRDHALEIAGLRAAHQRQVDKLESENKGLLALNLKLYESSRLVQKEKTRLEVTAHDRAQRIETLEEESRQKQEQIDLLNDVLRLKGQENVALNERIKQLEDETSRTETAPENNVELNFQGFVQDNYLSQADTAGASDDVSNNFGVMYETKPDFEFAQQADSSASFQFGQESETSSQPFAAPSQNEALKKKHRLRGPRKSYLMKRRAEKAALPAVSENDGEKEA